MWTVDNININIFIWNKITHRYELLKKVSKFAFFRKIKDFKKYNILIDATVIDKQTKVKFNYCTKRGNKKWVCLKLSNFNYLIKF